MKKASAATILLSGGIDSAAVAHFFKAQGFVTDALFVEYGQAAVDHERRAASKLAKFLDVPLQKLKIVGLHKSGTGELVGRNALLITAALFSSAGRSSVITLGIHGGTPYYDCSRAFIASIDRLISEQTDGRVSVVAPFVDWSKKDVYDYFLEADLPIKLTYSCEAGSSPICGQCASCRDRRVLGC